MNFQNRKLMRIGTTWHRELEEEVVYLEKGGPPDLVMRTPRLHGLVPDGSAHFGFGPAIRSITEMMKNE